MVKVLQQVGDLSKKYKEAQTMIGTLLKILNNSKYVALLIFVFLTATNPTINNTTSTDSVLDSSATGIKGGLTPSLGQPYIK